MSMTLNNVKLVENLVFFSLENLKQKWKKVLFLMVFR